MGPSCRSCLSSFTGLKSVCVYFVRKRLSVYVRVCMCVCVCVCVCEQGSEEDGVLLFLAATKWVRTAVCIAAHVALLYGKVNGIVQLLSGCLFSVLTSFSSLFHVNNYQP